MVSICKPIALFRRQRGHAKKRGIRFLFTFEEWLQWWVKHCGVDWEKRRGVHPHEYVMARYRDKGPYVTWNVKCVTNLENWRESYLLRKQRGTFTPPPHFYGEEHPNSKLSAKQARSIFLSVEPNEIEAAKHGVHWKTVHNIRHRRVWRAETEGLVRPPPAKRRF